MAKAKEQPDQKITGQNTKLLLAWTREGARCSFTLSPSHYKAAKVPLPTLATQMAAAAFGAIASGMQDRIYRSQAVMQSVAVRGCLDAPTLLLLTLKEPGPLTTKQMMALADGLHDRSAELCDGYATWLTIAHILYPPTPQFDPLTNWLHKAHGVVFVDDVLYIADNYKYHTNTAPRHGTWLQQLALSVAVALRLGPFPDSTEALKTAWDQVQSLELSVVLVSDTGAWAPPFATSLEALRLLWFGDVV